MSAVVVARRVDRVEVLSIDNPPINAINAAVRLIIAERLEALRGDNDVDGVVIEGMGRMFSGGGDLRELGRPEPEGFPTAVEVTNAIEQFPKPVVCALHGTTIGGGLLYALACHARIAGPDLSAALPEVVLGFVPGTGGTQRLPRLVGLQTALDMIVLTRRLDASAALSSGLVDAVVEHPSDRAVHWVGHGFTRRTCDLPAPPFAPELEQIYREKAGQMFPGRAAPQRAIELVLGSAAWPFNEGFQRAQIISRAMMETDEARELVRSFLDRRQRARSVGGSA